MPKPCVYSPFFAYSQHGNSEVRPVADLKGPLSVHRVERNRVCVSDVNLGQESWRFPTLPYYGVSVINEDRRACSLGRGGTKAKEELRESR